MRKVTDAGRAILRKRVLDDVARNGVDVSLRFDDLVWTAEDVWTQDSGVYEEFHKWIWKASNYQFNTAIKTIMRIASEERIGMSISHATRVDPRDFEERIGVKTGGYVGDSSRHDPHIILQSEPQEEQDEQRNDNQPVRTE
jgi:hypothetical protein